MKFMNAKFTRLLIAFFLIFSTLKLASQDIHFSQFSNTPANLNPALTGVFPGDLRFIGNYRSQWKSVPVPYQTFSGAFDTKLFHPKLGKNAFLGWGLVFNSDVAGNADLSLTQIGGNIAYTRQISDVVFATVGVQLMAGQRSVHPDQLTFEEQWNGDIFDPSSSNNEFFSSTNKGLSSISTGFNIHYQVEGARTKFDLGAGIFHLNQPNTSFNNDPDVKLPMKFSPHFISTFQVSPKIDVRFNAIFSNQMSYQEIVGGAAFRYHLSLEKNKELAIQGGISARLKDSFIPSVELQVRNWTAGFSYDINTSEFKAATLRRGGPEFFVQYVIWKVRAPKEFKACPVF